MSEGKEMMIPVEEEMLPFDYGKFEGIRRIPLEGYNRMMWSKITDYELRNISSFVIKQMLDYKMSLHDFFLNLYQLLRIRFVDEFYSLFFSIYDEGDSLKEIIFRYYRLYPDVFVTELLSHKQLVERKHFHLWKLFKDELKAKVFQQFYTMGNTSYIGYLTEVGDMHEFIAHLDLHVVITLINKMNEEKKRIQNQNIVNYCNNIIDECIHAMMRRSKLGALIELYDNRNSAVELIRLLKKEMNKLSSPFNFHSISQNETQNEKCILYMIIIFFERLVRIDSGYMLQIHGISNVMLLHNILAHFPPGSEERNKLTNEYLEIIDLSIDLSTDRSEENSSTKRRSSEDNSEENLNFGAGAIKRLKPYDSEENSQDDLEENSSTKRRRVGE